MVGRRRWWWGGGGGGGGGEKIGRDQGELRYAPKKNSRARSVSHLTV